MKLMIYQLIMDKKFHKVKVQCMIKVCQMFHTLNTETIEVYVQQVIKLINPYFISKIVLTAIHQPIPITKPRKIKLRSLNCSKSVQMGIQKCLKPK